MADTRPGREHFEQTPAPFGARALTVQVGPIAVRFEGLDGGLFEESGTRYGPFLSEAAPLHRVSVHPGDSAYLDKAPDGYLRLEEVDAEGWKRLYSHDFAAQRRGGEGRLRIAPSSDREAPVRALENYLRWVVADLALDRGGFVLHGAGLVRDGSAHLFFGPSGAGKSTVTGLSEGCAILSDDLVLLLRGDSGWRAATTPFAGTFPQGAKERRDFPLKGLYRLIQSPEDRLEPLAPGLAVGKVLSCCPFVGDPAARRDRLMPLVEACCRAVPPVDLHFRKSPDFWRLIA